MLFRFIGLVFGSKPSLPVPVFPNVVPFTAADLGEVKEKSNVGGKVLFLLFARSDVSNPGVAVYYFWLFLMSVLHPTDSSTGFGIVIYKLVVVLDFPIVAYFYCGPKPLGLYGFFI